MLPLLDLRRAGSSFQASIPTLKGKAYHLEMTEALGANDWRLFSSVPGDGLMITLTDAEAKGPQRFYRLRVE